MTSVETKDGRPFSSAAGSALLSATTERECEVMDVAVLKTLKAHGKVDVQWMTVDVSQGVDRVSLHLDGTIGAPMMSARYVVVPFGDFSKAFVFNAGEVFQAMGWPTTSLRRRPWPAT